MVWTKQRMTIAGQIMRIQAWTPSFKPDEETPLVPIWISLPELPWHCYNKEFITSLLSPIGRVLYLDSASINKTRGSQARVKVQVDLTRDRPSHIWMGYIGEDITDGRWQKIEYDNIPDYCFYCKNQGHNESVCIIKKRDVENKKKKDLNKNKDKQDTVYHIHEDVQSHKGVETDLRELDHIQQSYQIQDNQQQPIQEEWQIQKRRNQSQQVRFNVNRVVTQQVQTQTGMVPLPTKNTYIDLEVQEFNTADREMEAHNDLENRHQSTSITEGNKQKNQKNKQTGDQQVKITRTGIDSITLSPAPLNVPTSVVNVGVADGGEDGIGQETLKSNLSRLDKGKGKLSDQHSIQDKIPPDKTNPHNSLQISNKTGTTNISNPVNDPNNPQGEILDEYKEPDSEDEYDDTQSLVEGIEPGGEISTGHQIQKGSLLDNSNMDEIRDVTGKQGLSPRDMGYSGQPYTWCSHRKDGSRIWKRLDRGVVNDNWLDKMPSTNITHLPSVGSDHCPLLMECWKKTAVGNPMWILHTKMKRLTNTLREWSKKEYGDIFEKVKQYEKGVKEAEDNYIMNNSQENREKLYASNAQYIKYLKLEHAILQQKTQLHWLKEGDANSKYFHAVIRGKRKRMFIHKIMDEKGGWIQGEDHIARETCDYYKNIFNGSADKINEEHLHCIPRLVTKEQNSVLERIPNEEELRKVVMNMNPHSAPGPDGIGGKFYQCCFDIIKDDLLAAVQAFFNGYEMPKYMTHSCLILLPKIDHPSKLKDFRPISLSNFTNKIISKIISTRLTPILPFLVSENQSGFVKGRSISENIMLAQEVIHGIKLPKEGKNVVIKLDMIKAYDRVSWTYTCLVLRKMGFGEVFIDRIWRIMSNNWYSVVINGKRHGFFHSTRGLKQGDPLSPALFILGAEAFSRQLNSLYNNHDYIGFQMDSKGPQINHLSFADDIIIFTSTDRLSLQSIMNTIRKYELTSNQRVNKDKSFFMVTDKTNQDIIDNIKNETGFCIQHNPITYLGCPLYIGCQKIIYFSNIVEKIIKKIAGWQTKILNFGGKVILVKHVLQSIPIHILAAVSPPKTILKHIHKVIADFFWGNDKDGKKYHWASWETLAYPTSEGGIGVRSLHDICTAFQYKHWWEFRTKNSLWSKFLKAKYCKRANPVSKKYDTRDSLVWRYFTRNRQAVESYIRWNIKSGSCSFWWDNWLGNDSLANLCINISSLNNKTVADFLINDNGQFTIASAWEIIRKKKPKDIINNSVWHKQIPFKIAFFIWRALRGKLPTNETIQKFGKVAVECYCCYKKGTDDIQHILITGNFAKYIWKYYTDTIGAIQTTNDLRSLCAVKYGDKKSSIHRVQYGIFKDVMQTIQVSHPNIPWQHSWYSLINLVEQCQQQLSVIMVSWNKPQEGIYKLNTDGSALPNSGKIGGGGILRDHKGNLHYAFSIPFGLGTNNIAEIEAARYGLHWCEQHGYRNIILEVDSEILCKWISNTISIPWRYQHTLQQIQDIGRKLDHFECRHVYREANGTADMLSKWSHNLETLQHFYATRQLKGAIRGSYILEKMGIQNFRRRKIKRIKHPP
ncbi:uncharacterized protein [Solanum lycopersicum]|uniref:uncharacterized protein n=1 Tax=Solanum lycopersicum TaxID=4081 RepID=UPI003747F922